MRIDLASVLVDDQERAQRFYTDILGFQVKMDVPVGEFKWLTVVSPEQPDGVQLVLEPSNDPIGKAYQQGLYAKGIPATSFGVSNVQAEYERLSGLGVQFVAEPAAEAWGTTAVFDDTCGNLIQIHES
jgi:catechol 2,3-dioxygenase-like lactoylglutathione lyase family enzyme